MRRKKRAMREAATFFVSSISGCTGSSKLTLSSSSIDGLEEEKRARRRLGLRKVKGEVDTRAGRTSDVGELEGSDDMTGSSKSNALKIMNLSVIDGLRKMEIDKTKTRVDFKSVTGVV